MRLDKYLKVSRVVKRRTLAQELCAGGHVKRNGRTAKPSSEVNVGDIIELDFGSRKEVLRVLSIRENPDKEEAASMYEILSGSK